LYPAFPQPLDIGCIFEFYRFTQEGCFP